MDQTAEMRWFFRRPVPRSVLEWFERFGGEPVERTDLYLRLSGTEALGVKVRGGTGRLEFKLREQPSVGHVLSGGVVGDLERWERWSFARPRLARWLPKLGLPAQDLLEVGKRRRLAVFELGADGQVSLAENGGAPETGCRGEFTRLQAVGQEWTTLGFEAFGAEEQLLPALLASAESFFGQLEITGGLDADFSCGYPGWLNHL